MSHARLPQLCVQRPQQIPSSLSTSVRKRPPLHTHPQESPPPILLQAQITEGEAQRDADAVKLEEERVKETKDAAQGNSSPRTKVILQDPGQSLMASEWLFVTFIPGNEPHNSLYSIVVTCLVTSHVRIFATPWTAQCQASLSFTISCSLLKLMSIESVMLSNHE